MRTSDSQVRLLGEWAQNGQRRQYFKIFRSKLNDGMGQGTSDSDVGGKLATFRREDSDVEVRERRNDDKETSDCSQMRSWRTGTRAMLGLEDLYLTSSPVPSHYLSSA